MSDWQPSVRMQKLAERRGVAIPVALPYRTLGDVINVLPLRVALRNSLQRHYMWYLRNTQGDGMDEHWRDIPLPQVIEDIRSSQVHTMRNVGKKSIAELRRVFLGGP